MGLSLLGGRPGVLPKNKMRRYQGAATQFIKDTKRCALFIEPGLGKTVSAGTAVRDLADLFEIGRTLIVGPQRVVRKVWPDEFKQWEHLKDFTYTVINGSPQARLKKLTQATEVHLVSHDLVPWLDSLIGTDHEYDVIIIDESSRFKNKDTNRWKAMRRLVARARYVVLLTGTPAPNGLHDLYAQIYLLDYGKRLGHTITAFRERWFEQNWNEHGYRPREHTEKAIYSRIEDICFTLREQDYSELPPRVNNYIEIEFDDETRKQYKKFEKDYILELEDGGNIKAVSAAALTNKLLQLTNGVVYDRDRNGRPFHNKKIEALKEIVEDSQGQPIFVAYNFRTDIDQIKAAFPHAVVLGNNPKTIDDWNDGKIPLLIAHPKSAGHGLNLQFGGSIAVWFGLTWSLEDYQQFNKRLHRKGQISTVIIHHLIVKGTIDEDVVKSLQGKDDTQNDLMNALRRRIADVLGE